MNILKKFICLTCTLMLLFSLSACGEKEDPSLAFVGTWTLSSITLNDESTQQDLMEHLGKSGLSFQLVMNSDKSGTLDLAGTQSNFTWAVDESDTTKSLLDSEGNQLTVTLQEDGTLLMNESDMIITFSKQDSESSDAATDATTSDDSSK